MSSFAEYIKEIEIDQLWTGGKHIRWQLERHVNVLSGINGVGKSTIINKVLSRLSESGAWAADCSQLNGNGVSITVTPGDAEKIRFDIIRSFDRPL
ncbi:MAG: ATP-binding protein, partial [Oscillospiraceae bacterium]|nr:ATP-binding protein [Oscillospiraceae bacterium]